MLRIKKGDQINTDLHIIQAIIRGVHIGGINKYATERYIREAKGRPPTNVYNRSKRPLKLFKGKAVEIIIIEDD